MGQNDGEGLMKCLVEAFYETKRLNNSSKISSREGPPWTKRIKNSIKLSVKENSTFKITIQSAIII